MICLFLPKNALSKKYKDTKTAKMAPRGGYCRMETNQKETDIPAHVESTSNPGWAPCVNAGWSGSSSEQARLEGGRHNTKIRHELWYVFLYGFLEVTAWFFGGHLGSGWPTKKTYLSGSVGLWGCGKMEKWIFKNQNGMALKLWSFAHLHLRFQT